MSDGITATYDPEADAAYVYLVPGVRSQGRTRESTPSIWLDEVPHGDGWVVVGIELLNPKPRPRLAKVAAEYGFAHLLDDIYAVLDGALNISAGPPMKLGTTSCWVRVAA